MQNATLGKDLYYTEIFETWSMTSQYNKTPICIGLEIAYLSN